MDELARVGVLTASVSRFLIPTYDLSFSCLSDVEKRDKLRALLSLEMSRSLLESYTDLSSERHQSYPKLSTSERIFACLVTFVWLSVMLTLVMLLWERVGMKAFVICHLLHFIVAGGTYAACIAMQRSACSRPKSD